MARISNGAYSATKHAVGAFSESMRQELASRHVRISLVEPGATATELGSHNRPEIREQMAKRFAGVERLQAEASRARSGSSSPARATWRSTRCWCARPSRRG